MGAVSSVFLGLFILSKKLVAFNKPLSLAVNSKILGKYLGSISNSSVVIFSAEAIFNNRSMGIFSVLPDPYRCNVAGLIPVACERSL
nr:MAG TPA: hypothetical protein [Caudoviricetes sp.]